LLIERLENHLACLAARSSIDTIRGEISSSCVKCATREKGLYQLTVPTGGGKTLASLRFALHHAAHHAMDRVVYVVPYTSIIDQNAQVARSIFAPLVESVGQIVVEHHSNLTPEQDTPESKLLAENWDATIIYTTGVQLLETLFASGTRGVRRLHQLANAVIIFDEIQTLPVRTVHLFNNAVNFLTGQCGSTVIFCTATQPLLDQVEPQRGSARLSAHSQMVCNPANLFRQLNRAKIEDKCRPGGWTEEEVESAASQLLDQAGSVLVVVNKKAQARNLYLRLRGKVERVYHLSTSMCPAHRMKVLDEIKRCLDPTSRSPVICVSTQLIEAGVDVDFGAAIRYVAGLDSVAQTAGRCNRNGTRPTGRVLIVNPANEDLTRLPEIRAAQEVCLRVLDEYRADPAAFDHDLQSPATMSRYYSYYFFGRKHEMAFPVTPHEIGRDDDLLALLSTNRFSVEAYKATFNRAPPYFLRQSFMTAAKNFKAIESETEGVIVPYGEEGNRIIQQLCAGSQVGERLRLLMEAQRYSVNLLPHEIRHFKDEGKLFEMWEGSSIYYLDEQHYSEEFGASFDIVAPRRILIDGGKYV
jgi:CRISPR-associated endonuclease/helicase Cas3